MTRATEHGTSEDTRKVKVAMVEGVTSAGSIVLDEDLEGDRLGCGGPGKPSSGLWSLSQR